jgi:hypothetical protein
VRIREALRKLLTTSLRCPKCPAANRPGATYIEIDDTGSRAFCSVCSHAGPLDIFQPKEH